MEKIFIFLYGVYTVLNYQVVDMKRFNSEDMTLFFITAIIGSIIMLIVNSGFKDFLHKIYATITGGIIVGILIMIIGKGEVLIANYLHEAIVNKSLNSGFCDSLIKFIIIILMILGVPLLYTMLTIFIPELMKTRSKKFFVDCKQRKRTGRRNEILNDLYSKIGNVEDYDLTVCNNFDEDKIYLYDNTLKFVEHEGKKRWCTNEEREKLRLDDIEKIKEISNKLKKIDFNFIKNETWAINPEHKAFVQNIENKSYEIYNLINRRKYICETDYNNIKNGRLGEEAVNRELNEYENIYNLPNIRLEEPDIDGNMQSIENDNIIISRNGVFILEVKNFGLKGNYSIEIERDGRWIREYDKGKRDVMKSATAQNNRHIVYINKIINRVLGRGIENYIDAEGIVVISNDKVSITNHSENQRVVRSSEVYSYIKNKEAMLSLEEMNKLKDYFIENNLQEQSFPIYDYTDEIIKNVEIYNDEMTKIEKILDNMLEASRKLRGIDNC